MKAIIPAISNFLKIPKEPELISKPLIGDVDFEELKNQRLQLYDTLTFDLASARSDVELAFVGTYIYAIEVTGTDANIQVKFNESFRKAITLVKNRGLRIPFYRLFLSNVAQAGKSITLVVGSESDIFEVFDKGETMYGLAKGFAFADMEQSIIQGTWTKLIKNAQLYNFVVYNSTGAINDEISFALYAAIGVKTLEVLANTYSDGGIVTVFIDGVAQGTFDRYEALPGTDNKTFEMSVNFLTTGEHTINFKVTGKNPLSTNYHWSTTRLRVK